MHPLHHVQQQIRCEIALTLTVLPLVAAKDTPHGTTHAIVTELPDFP